MTLYLECCFLTLLLSVLKEGDDGELKDVASRSTVLTLLMREDIFSVFEKRKTSKNGFLIHSLTKKETAKYTHMMSTTTASLVLIKCMVSIRKLCDGLQNGVI